MQLRPFVPEITENKTVYLYHTLLTAMIPSKKCKLLFFVVLGLPAFFSATANNNPTTDPEARQISETPHVLEYLWLTNTWLHAANPAGLSMAEMHDLGNSFFSFNHQGGPYRRPQEADSIHRMGFSTERFQSLGDFRFRGEFVFETTRETNQKWSVVQDPFRGIPYVFADSSGGDWDKQYYNLNVGASSGKLLGLFYAGLEAHYELYTGARQNDPRPLNNTNHIWVRPGLLFPMGNRISLGLSGYYSNRNEEINITVNNWDVQHRYFKLRGVGEFRSGFMRSFFRAYNGDSFGGNLQFAYQHQGIHFLAEAGLRLRQEEVTDGTSLFEHGGDYEETVVDATIHLKLTGNHHVHLAKGFFHLAKDTGIEHSQSYDVELEKFITFATTLRYRGDRMQGGIHYHFIHTGGSQADYRWMAGLQADLQSADLRFLLPNSSQTTTSAHFTLLGKKNIPLAKNNLHLGLSGGYKLSIKDELRMHPDLVNSDRTVVTDFLTVPDFDYLVKDYITLGLELAYNFAFPGNPRNNLYIGIKADKIHLMDNHATDNGFFQDGRNFFQARIGMIY